MASNGSVGYRNGTQKNSSSKSSSSSSFKSKPSVASGVRRSSTGSVGGSTGSVKYDPGGYSLSLSLLCIFIC